MLCMGRNLSPKSSGTDALLSVDLDPRASLVADRAGPEYFLHGRPIGLDPTSVMAAIATGRDTNLSKLQLRAAAYFRDVEDGDRVMVWPPSRRTPCLHDLFARLEHEIDAR